MDNGYYKKEILKIIDSINDTTMLKRIYLVIVTFISG